MEKNTFIEKARKIHGDTYDYSMLPDEFKVKEKVSIICPVHGVFIQTAHDHLSGCKCRKCKYSKLSKKNSDTKETFIKKAMAVHGNKYDYSKVDYVDNKTKVCIICHEISPLTGKEHGEFWQTPNAHIQKRGCPVCKQEKLSNSGLKNAEQFFKKCEEKFNGKYCYENSVYKNNSTPILIKCPEHGEFWQTPKMHLNGYGCPKCSYKIRTEGRKSNTEEFIRRAKEIHGDKYDYSKVKYVDANTKICIVCHKIGPYGNEHGEFWQLPSHHLYGYGCDKCAKDNLRSTTEDFIKKAQAIHGNKYDYSKVTYRHSKDKITIVCPKHGDFEITPNSHLLGYGCPYCGGGTSQSENEIYSYVCSLVGKENVIKKDRQILGKYELDIYVPSKKIAIEYDGLYWHSEENGKDKFYHLNKTEMCAKQNVKLIHIFEDEYKEHKEIVLNKLKYILSCSDNEKIAARKTTVTDIDKTTAKEFLNKNHIQGFAKSTFYLGCYYNGTLIAVMTFVRKNKKDFELNRFATDNNYTCQGVGGKMFKHFIRNYDPYAIKSFADRRWTPMAEDNIYVKLGFELKSSLRPDYYYVINGKRVHKFNCRKKRLNKKFGLPLTMTENEMTNELGYSKIWNCGLIKYVWTNKNHEKENC